MLCRQVEEFWRRGRAYKHHLFMVKAPASPSVKQCTSLCLSDLSQFVWPPPCHANLMQLRNLAAVLQGKTITRFVLRLASCSVLGTIHKSRSELQVVEAEAASQTAAAVQQVSTQLQGKFKLTITYRESKKGLLIPALSHKLELASFSQNAKVFHPVNRVFFPAPCPHVCIILLFRIIL